MSMKTRILVFAGSAREQSFNKKLARIAAAAVKKEGAEATFIDLRDFPMPVFGEDFEAGLQPQEEPHAKRFKDLLRSHDAFIIASPENNWTYSALLKNALDWASRRREGEKPLECFSDKVVGLLSASPGPFGGIRGLPQLAMLLRNLRCIVLPDQVCVARAGQAFKEDGTLQDPEQQAAVERVAARVVAVATRLKA
jgi:chromate reductase